MYKVQLRKNKRIRRKLRIKDKVVGSPEKPRLSVFRSNKYVYAQIIDDTKGITLASVDSEAKELHKEKAKAVAAFETGKKLAEIAKEKKIKTVIFDRNGFRYQGRIKALAEGAREGGLKL